MNTSVIIPVWNGIADLPSCLSALFDLAQPPDEVIAVDNASSDDSATYIATEFPQVKLIRNPQNVGFSAACNIGLRHASGETLVLLNQDTEVRPGWLAALKTTLAEDSAIGIVGSKALFADGTIQHAGGQINEQGYGIHIGHYEQDNGQYDQRVDVDYVTGASLAISRRTYNDVGGFDRNFGISYYEDVDLCYRVRAAGYRVVYEPTSVLIHNENSVSIDGSIESDTRVQKNRLRFVFKNWPAEKLMQEFVPQEYAWLTNLGPENPLLVNSIRRAYLRLMMSSAELSTYRQTRFQDSLNVLQVIQPLWSSLEMQERLRPLDYNEPQRIAHLNVDSKTEMGTVLALNIDAIRQRHPVTPQPFRSDVPVIGSLIAGFRQRWNRVAAEWFVRPLVAQQNEINSLMLHAFEQVAAEQKHAAHLESAYVGELVQKISQLEETVQHLQRQITNLQKSDEPGSDSNPKE